VYLCQQTQQVQVGRNVGYRVLILKVELDPSGRPVWRAHSAGEVYLSDYAARYHSRKGVLYLQRPEDGKLVTPAEAARLTGFLAPAALDYLTEQVNDSETVQNYQTPKKERRKR
jgi:hypothetical protein